MTKERDDLDLHLKPTFAIDSDSEVVKEKATFLTEEYKSQREKAKALFYFVRDKIKYTPYPPLQIEEYRASKTLQRGEGFCVQKAVVLTALARVVGIPARLGFADIKNHLTPKKLMETMGTNIFIYHGYSELRLNDKWVKATPAFNIEMCNKFDIKPVEFDGVTDAMLHKWTKKGEPHIEYLKYHGTFADLPFKEIMQAFFNYYPRARAHAELRKLVVENFFSTPRSFKDINEELHKKGVEAKSSPLNTILSVMVERKELVRVGTNGAYLYQQP